MSHVIRKNQSTVGNLFPNSGLILSDYTAKPYSEMKRSGIERYGGVVGMQYFLKV